MEYNCGGTASTSHTEILERFKFKVLADFGRILVRAGCGYKNGSPDTNS
jgi:hypothetical protein